MTMPRTLLLGFLFIAATLCHLCSAGAALADGNAVSAGDTVAMNFSCYDDAGGLVFSSIEKVARDASKTKSALFIPPFKDEFKPFEVIANSGVGGPLYFGPVPTLEVAMAGELSKAIVGMQPGKPNTVAISAEPMTGLTDDDRYLTMSRRSILPRERKIALDLLQQLTGKDTIKPGMTVEDTAGFKTIVSGVEGNAAVLRIEFEEGAKVETQTGPAIITSVGDDQFQQELIVREGDVSMAGAFIGRIIKVEDQTYLIDYGLPLGGETFKCDVVVEEVLKKFQATK